MHTSGGYWRKKAAGYLTPSLISEIAQELDRKKGEVVKRNPTNLMEEIKTTIPGLRQQVPEKKK